MRYGLMSRWITYQKVLLATYWLADSMGFLCPATDADLARESGRGLRSVRRSLAEMRRAGLVEILGRRDGLRRRVIVLLDIPAGLVFMEHFNRTRRHRERFRARRQGRRGPRIAGTGFAEEVG